MIDELIETLTWMLKALEAGREFGGPSAEFMKAERLLERLERCRGGGIVSENTLARINAIGDHIIT